MVDKSSSGVDFLEARSSESETSSCGSGCISTSAEMGVVFSLSRFAKAGGLPA